MDDGTFFNLFDYEKSNYGFWLSPKGVRGQGSAVAPSLVFTPEFQSRSGSTRESLWHSDIQTASVSLWDLNQSSYPVFESGLQYFDANRPALVLPITVPFLETLRSAVQLSLRFAVWLPPAAYPDQALRVVQSRTEPIVLDPTYWQTEVLPALGYPHVRLVPLTLDLPATLSVSTQASTTWKKAMDSLSQALQVYQSYHAEPTNIIGPLRLAVEYALIAWTHLWQLRVPDSQKAADLLRGLNACVRPCNAPNGIIPARAQYGRLCSTLVLIHDLLQLTNPELHAGTAGTYRLAEAETILYRTAGILRGLPDLWNAYPTPPTVLTEIAHPETRPES